MIPLKTPHCLTKANKIKKQKQLENEQTKQAKKKLLQQQQATLQQQQVREYLNNLTEDQTAQLKQTFNDSKAASGLKFGQPNVDFSKPLVNTV